MQSVLSSPAHAGRLALDEQKYLEHVKNCALSDAQQREYLQILWSIMATFVELGFGLDSVQQALPALEHAERRSPGIDARELQNSE